MLFWLPGLSPAILARGVKSARFAAARGGLLRLAAARHAAHAHSRECRARPDVEKTRHGLTRHLHGEPHGEKIADRFPAISAESRPGRSLRPACRGAPPPTTRPALAPRGVRHGLTSAGPVLSTHARARGVENGAGGAGRPDGVDLAAQNHFLGVDQAARTSHSRMRGKLSGLEL